MNKIVKVAFFDLFMKPVFLLLIEAKHTDHPAFTSALRKKGFGVEVVSSGKKALARLEKEPIVNAVVVDAASLRTSGKRICQSLREKQSYLPIILILDADASIEDTSANATLTLPFTAQKLVNRIRNLLPGEGKNNVKAGPIQLDVENHIVRCLGRQSRITPRLVALLRILIEHRGEVVERKVLFSKVWETDYTDDTRTLDVHISWLRQTIEVDPTHPRFLRTVRGIGYRLDV
jgi:DNA-binding response OmpR family regulator